MKFILPLSGILLFVVCASGMAQGPEEEYVRVYNLIQQADAVKDRDDKAALEGYLKAQDALTKIKAEYSTWNSNIVNFRLKYLKEKIEPLEQKYPQAPKMDEVSPVTMEKMSGLEEQLHKMNDELIRLRTDRAKLEDKLKEALTASPSPVDPGTIEEARQQIEKLNKQIEIQNTLLTSGRNPSGSSEAAKQLKMEREKNEKLEKEIKKMDALLTDPGAKLPGDTLNKLEKENEALKKKYQEALRQLFEKKKELIQ